MFQLKIQAIKKVRKEQNRHCNSYDLQKLKDFIRHYLMN